MDLNKASLIGNVMKTPESYEVKGKTMTIKLVMATNYTWIDRESKKKQQSVEFHNIEATGHLAEIINEYVHKGDKLYVEGRIESKNTLAQNGEKVYLTYIVADDIIMLGKRKDKSNA